MGANIKLYFCHVLVIKNFHLLDDLFFLDSPVHLHTHREHNVSVSDDPVM